MLARELRDRQLEASVLCNLGKCYEDLGDVSRAVGVERQALAIARDVGDRQLEVAVLSNLGQSYGHLNDFTVHSDCATKRCVLATRLG